MDCLRHFLAAQLQRTPRCEYNPDEVVAMGAAIQAALIEENSAVEDMVMTDVCPHTLGIEISKFLGGQYLPGYFEPVIHRNTTIPVSKEKTFTTVAANQTDVLVRVFQGEGRRSADNLLLGELKVDGIPLGPAGTSFDVRFSYDPSGILEVEVVLGNTGKSRRAVIAHPETKMDAAQIDLIVRKLQKIKFYPRDLVENQFLLRYSEQLLGDLPIDLREELNGLMDVFEDSMRSGDPEYFEQMKQQLLFWLSSRGYPFDGGPDAGT